MHVYWDKMLKLSSFPDKNAASYRIVYIVYIIVYRYSKH